MSRFSIIIPTFNADKYIEKCLHSILKQSYSDYEIIIVDGASTDSTIDITRQFTESGLLKIHIEKDNGIYDAQNKGLSYAKGDWIIFLGADDYFNDRNILLKISSITNENHDIVYGNVIVAGNTPWAHDGAIYDGQFCDQKILIKNICQQAIFYNKKVFSKRAFNTKYRICADWDFNLYAWKQFKFSYFDINICTFNAGGTSTKNLYDSSFINDYQNNIKSYFYT